MKTRKILAAAMAGLCAVSTMGVSAFATVVTEKIETSGAKSYKVSAGFQAPTIDVTVPESVLGVINPYKINVEIEGETFEAEGVASPKYTITNNSTEVGINVKATFSAEGLDGLVDAADKATDPTKNTDKKKYAYVTLNATTPMEIETAAGTVAAGDDNQLVFSADAANPEKTDVLMKLDVKGTDGSGEFWIGGDVIEEPAEKWTTSDKLSINVVLDINPFNTCATTTTGFDGLTALSVTKNGAEQITGFAAGTKTYNVSGAAAFDSYTITATAASGTAAMTCPAATGGANGSLAGSTLTIGNTLPLAVTITVTDGANTDTYTINFTV